MSDTSARLSLPWLAPGQAQKELFHNEALALLDAAVMATVETVGATVPPTAPAAGQCWALGGSPGGAWSGRGLAIAAWTDGGWRFVPTRSGMSVWSLADGVAARRTADGWVLGEIAGRTLTIGGVQVVGPRGGAIAAPAGGAVVDAEARSVLGALLATLRQHGLIAA